MNDTRAVKCVGGDRDGEILHVAKSCAVVAFAQRGGSMSDLESQLGECEAPGCTNPVSCHPNASYCGPECWSRDNPNLQRIIDATVPEPELAANRPTPSDGTHSPATVQPSVATTEDDLDDSGDCPACGSERAKVTASYTSWKCGSHYAPVGEFGDMDGFVRTCMCGERAATQRITDELDRILDANEARHGNSGLFSHIAGHVHAIRASLQQGEFQTHATEGNS